jgi:hypothetical protein
MWRRIDILLTDVSEERIASIFMVSEIRERWTGHLLTLIHRSRIFYTLKMEAICSSETLVNKISTLRPIPEDDIFRCNNVVCRRIVESLLGLILAVVNIYPINFV